MEVPVLVSCPLHYQRCRCRLILSSSVLHLLDPQLAQTDKHLPITGFVEVKSLARLEIHDRLLLVVVPILLLAHE